MLPSYNIEAVACLERTLYRSPSAWIADVLAYGCETIAVPAGSIAFVRSGYFTTQHSPEAIVDANYAFCGGQRQALLAGACKHICACTIISHAAPEASELHAGCVPASSTAFLLHTTLVSDARLRRGDPEAGAFELLCRMRNSPQVPDACAHSPLVTEIRRLVNEQTYKRVSLAAIGRQFYVSPFTVSRVFHRETGMRLRDYALQLRLRRGLSLLIHSRRRLTDVAIDLGFYDEPHFSKAFRSEFGISPHSVRKYCTRSDFC